MKQLRKSASYVSTGTPIPSHHQRSKRKQTPLHFNMQNPKTENEAIPTLHAIYREFHDAALSPKLYSHHGLPYRCQPDSEAHRNHNSTLFTHTPTPPKDRKPPAPQRIYNILNTIISGTTSIEKPTRKVHRKIFNKQQSTTAHLTTAYRLPTST